MLRGNMMNALGGFERLLLFLGLLLLSVYASARIYSSLYSHLAVHEFWGSHGSLTAGNPTGASRRNPGIPDFRLWSEKRIEAYHMSLLASVPPPLGVLRIPSVDLNVPVLEGTDDLALNRGVGHIAGTSALDQGGNVGIAGHRDGFFRGLKDVHLGDKMDLYTENGNSRYVVDEIVIVPPEDVSVLTPRSKPTLTLVTCYPFYFVGSAPLRYIVHASITNANSLSASHLPHTLAKEGGGRDKK
jgi:sortase A